ncbi:hypothetical protein Cantr_00796 [Candida viswanathii]|uniref:Uncharacterized protein n=1 Tax=Candida viswanathii TaxID=5486 RepID=A0A367YGZ2_9ASCO|nr:hypothetical protein Cantr_00796 [Candida viswanathii]
MSTNLTEAVALVAFVVLVKQTEAGMPVKLVLPLKLIKQPLAKLLASLLTKLVKQEKMFQLNKPDKLYEPLRKVELGLLP